ncbi:hypothetical protein NK718_03835 [Alsobacter sp. SYSU M60028]|uniref:Sarcosine oxidase subunit alpha family protein n=1 Tax=Alsobacter ponti TaxID=2962936 RepID=A0ABT1L813_9HYPH|nr:hypothetical protein [Alsobacter ponti]
MAEARAAVAVPKSGGAPAARDPAALDAAPAWPNGDAGGRAWIDLQSDVTVKDVGIAARENYASVEHLKRYTTLGMATDQGKTSNVNGIAALAAATGRAPGEVGTTTYRPPYVPVPFSAIAGLRGGERMNPVRRLPLEARHRALGATLGEYGGWLRPAYYGPGDMTEAVAREIRAAREAVAVFDASPLGKIEVIGPDAARFMDFQSYMTLSTLAPGRMRYGFMLEETGIVFDDGVVSRLDENRFRVSCSTSHVAAMHARFETWRQDQFDPARLFIHNATTHWATLAVSGPLSRLLMERLSIVADLSDAALPHMAFVEGRFAGGPATVARVSFTGERGYEVSVPAARAAELHERLLAAGRDLGVAPLGIEALMALRAEKGFVVVGLDTDGTTMPHDLGFGGPRLKRTGDFVGKRSLFTQAAEAADRKQLVGLDTVDGAPLPRGAHVVARDGGRLRSEGFVTSSYASPALRRPVALGLVARGAARHGEEVTLRHLGRELRARLRPPCAYDAKGDRLNA